MVSSPATTDKKENGRFRIVRIAVFVIGGLLAFRYASLMLFPGSVGTGPERQIDIPDRGSILDRNGRILAAQVRQINVSVWVPNLKEPEETATLLSPILDISEEELLDSFSGKQSNYVLLKRRISDEEEAAIRSLKDEKKLFGISLEPVSGRNYPDNKLASHVIGYTDIDNIGRSGIERTMTEYLVPRERREGISVEPGDNVHLTLDVNIQYFAEKTAARLMQEHKAESVMLLIMKADTGEYLGFASLPDFDPNLYFEATDSERSNRPVTHMYEPGSVFKVFSLAAFLNSGGITSSSVFTCNGSYTNSFLESPIKCLGVHGSVHPLDILKVSCNAGAAYASDTVTSDTFYSALRDFGFGSMTDLELNGEENGLLSGPASWSLRSKPSISMGQEIGVTAVQVMQAATAIANRGVLLKTHVVGKITSPDGTVIKENGREAVRRVLNPETAESVLSMMISGSETGGTGSRAGIQGMKISVKTGTAQVYDDRKKTYSDTKYIASSLGIFPSEKPEFIVYVVIENPMGDSIYGGRIAAPVIREAAEFLVPYIGLPFPGNRIVEHSGTVTVELPAPLKPGETVPDFRGMAKRTILPLLAQENVLIRMTGEGWVVRQSPPPGTPITDGMTIDLEFE